MKNMYGVKKYCIVLSMVLSVSCMCINGAVAELTASTSLTIVHLTNAKPQDISTYPGAWPEDYDDLINPDRSEQEVYLSNVHFTTSHLSWTTNPYPTPYASWGNGINSILTAVWSKDGGKTFQLLSWDYLGPYTTAKHISGMPDCWMGTMVSTLCGQKAGECNGQFRSNLYFTEYPSGNGNCWGTVD